MLGGIKYCEKDKIDRFFAIDCITLRRKNDIKCNKGNITDKFKRL